MRLMRVLVVNGFADSAPPLVEYVESTLRSQGHQVDRCNLAEQGLDQFMSAEERHAYHGPQPLITPETRAAADQINQAQAVVIIYPQTHHGFPSRVKSWQERVFVPGIAFRFKPSGVVTGALDHLKRALVIETITDPGHGPSASRPTLTGNIDPPSPRRQRSWRWPQWRLWRRSHPGPSLARSFFLSSNRQCKARFVALAPNDSQSVARQLNRWAGLGAGRG